MRKIAVFAGSVLAALCATLWTSPVSADCASQCANAWGGYQTYNYTTCYNLQCRTKSGSYGAIAYGAKSLAYGYGFGKSSKSEAEQTAMGNCRANGNDCKVVVDMLNNCAAVAAVEDKGRFTTGLGATRSAAQAGAMNACKSQVGGQCQIEVWTCSTP